MLNVTISSEDGDAVVDYMIRARVNSKSNLNPRMSLYNPLWA